MFISELESCIKHLGICRWWLFIWSDMRIKHNKFYIKRAIREIPTDRKEIRDKTGHAFPNGISSKMNVIVQLEFELTYNNVAV